MIDEGQMVLFHFPHTDQRADTLRPALTLRKLPGRYDDWLICMVSSQLSQAISGLDEVVSFAEPDFSESGLKRDSVIRVFRLAVVDQSIRNRSIESSVSSYFNDLFARFQ